MITAAMIIAAKTPQRIPTILTKAAYSSANDGENEMMRHGFSITKITVSKSLAINLNTILKTITNGRVIS